MLSHIDLCAKYTGTDIFLLKSRADAIPQLTTTSSGDGIDSGLDQRYRVNIFGDIESVEHAKTRTLMMIDQIVRMDKQDTNSILTPRPAQTQDRRDQARLDHAHFGIWSYWQEHQND